MAFAQNRAIKLRSSELLLISLLEEISLDLIEGRTVSSIT
jgi:hypothetical protein